MGKAILKLNNYKNKKKKTEPEKPPEQTVYESYKQRGEIETMLSIAL